MTTHSAWLQTTGQGRVDTRLALAAGMAPATSLTSRGGVVADGGLTLQSTAAMQCQITPGRAYVQGTAAQGAYPVAVDAAVPLTVPDGDPQYGRIDTVVLKIQDDQFDGSGLTQATVVLVPGTPAATPAPPTLSPAWMPLFQISVPTKTSAGTGGLSWTTAVTDLRVYTAALGGIVPAVTTPWTPAAAGQYTDLNGLLQRYNGSAWNPVYDPATLGNTPMVTSTTRPTGIPVGKQVYETDTGRISLWNGTAWVSEWDPTAYTSTARPSNNWPGRVIYETDTHRFSAYNGASWTTLYDPAGGWSTWQTITAINTGWAAISSNAPRYRTGPGGLIQLTGGATLTQSYSGETGWMFTGMPNTANQCFFALASNYQSTYVGNFSASGSSININFTASANVPVGTQFYFDATWSLV
jgi:hypothetical protein